MGSTEYPTNTGSFLLKLAQGGQPFIKLPERFDRSRRRADMDSRRPVQNNTSSQRTNPRALTTQTNAYIDWCNKGG